MDTVLLTGAASGIGRATARRLASQGHRCILVDRNEQALQALRTELPVSAGQDHRVCVADLTDVDQIAALPDGMPKLDALINNAGMTDSSNRATVDLDPDDWQRLLDLNLRAPARMVDALRARLVRGARVVNVASGAGLRAIPWRGGYSPSKAGLIAQSRALAQADAELCVIVLCPGYVRTELVAGLIASGRLDPARAVAKIPLGRLADPEELACALAFMASGDAVPMAGSLLCVDGGSSVYGGSQTYAPADGDTRAPSDTPLSLTVRGEWPAPDDDGTSGDQHGGYHAVLDATALSSPPGQRLAAVLEAARRFDIDGPGSLTVLLPGGENLAWEHAGDHAAARMLVASLACEWGPAARRINAVEVAPGMTPDALAPLLRFAAGAQAQYLTGQVLCRR
ncbi:SDR family NAD(P)-dependent oxidoreductase [Achromobacter sp.]|uniref:SDR family NAD(P)-dependent oxidoreductase n=1 Tax=Achromobacter sp. TaxID=134375 RepID=UPI0028ADEB88|nr:SDR family oxidoreductase [Achromobacter sp.]